MSVSYWMIQGVGIDTDKIEPFIDKEKLAAMLIAQLPDDDELLDIVEKKEYDKLHVEDYLYGEPFNNLADLLTHCDDTDSITYGDDGECGSYFYYPPSMPWQRTENEPNTLEEVHHRIIKAIQVITNLSHEEIDAMINDDLYVVGCG